MIIARTFWQTISLMVRHVVLLFGFCPVTDCYICLCINIKILNDNTINNIIFPLMSQAFLALIGMVSAILTALSCRCTVAITHL